MIYFADVCYWIRHHFRLLPVSTFVAAAAIKDTFQNDSLNTRCLAPESMKHYLFNDLINQQTYKKTTFFAIEHSLTQIQLEQTRNSQEL